MSPHSDFSSLGTFRVESFWYPWSQVFPSNVFIFVHRISFVHVSSKQEGYGKYTSVDSWGRYLFWPPNIKPIYCVYTPRYPRSTYTFRVFSPVHFRLYILEVRCKNHLMTLIDYVEGGRVGSKSNLLRRDFFTFFTCQGTFYKGVRL